MRERRSSRAFARAAATLPTRCFTPASTLTRPIGSSQKIDAVVPPCGFLVLMSRGWGARFICSVANPLRQCGCVSEVEYRDAKAALGAEGFAHNRL
jgi:hypothetical protein